MPRRKKRFARQSAILIFSFLLVSCGSLPQKPAIVICAHDAPKYLVYCENIQGGSSTLNIEDTDRYVMFSPDNWGLILGYIRALERYTRSNKSQKQNIADELRKTIKADSRLRRKL